jgi:ABC-2 type transport system ATP-binding protein
MEYVVKTELKEKNILEIYVNSKTDVKPELNKLIVNNGAQVFKLIENSLSLEDAYFSATGMKDK